MTKPKKQAATEGGPASITEETPSIKPSKRKPTEDSVVRIHKSLHERILAYAHVLKLPPTKKGKKRIATLNEILDMIMDNVDKLYQAPVYYAASHVLHQDVSEARGDAILYSVHSKQPVVLPFSLLVIGQDNGQPIAQQNKPMDEAMRKQ